MPTPCGADTTWGSSKGIHVNITKIYLQILIEAFVSKTKNNPIKIWYVISLSHNQQSSYAVALQSWPCRWSQVAQGK